MGATSATCAMLAFLYNCPTPSEAAAWMRLICLILFSTYLCSQLYKLAVMAMSLVGATATATAAITQATAAGFCAVDMTGRSAPLHRKQHVQAESGPPSNPTRALTAAHRRLEPFLHCWPVLIREGLAAEATKRI